MRGVLAGGGGKGAGGGLDPPPAAETGARGAGGMYDA